MKLPDNPWGLGDAKPPHPDEFFNGTFDAMLAFCDFLQHNMVFINAVSGKLAHMDSYNTLVSFENLDRALLIIQTHLKPSREQWQNLLATYDGPNNQPAGQLAFMTILRKVLP